MNIVTGGANTVTYNYANNQIVATVQAGTTDDQLATMINTQLGSLFSATGSGGGHVATAQNGLVMFTAATGNNGGVIDPSATYTTIAGLITNATNSPITATATGTTAQKAMTVSNFTQSATLGSVNAGLPSDLNNGIQLFGGANASTLPVTFVNNGNNQTLGVSLTTNTNTNGFSTAYVQGANANSTVQITAKNQGTQYDGITVTYNQSANDKSVVYNASAKTITVNNNFTGGVTAAQVVTQINNALSGAGGLFTASVLGGGAGGGNVTAGASGTTSGGNQYSGLVVNLATDSNGSITSTAANVISAINASTQLQNLGISAANLGSSTGAGLVTTGSTSFTQPGLSQANGYAQGTTVNQGGVNSEMTVTAKNSGSLYNNVGVVFVNDNTITAHGGEYAQYNASTKQLQIHIDSGVSTLNDVLANFNSTKDATDSALFSLAAVGTGAGVLYSTDTGTLTGGVTTTGSATGGVALAGNFDANEVVGTGLTLTSTGYGSNQFVAAQAIQGTFQTTNSAGQTSNRDTGSDVDVRINGIQAVGNGLQASIDTPSLAMSFNVGSTVASGTTLNFNVTGGGAQFQLGPDATSAQQARIGIGSVSTASLGGAAGLLYQLQSGGSLSLANNVDGAAQVANEAISQVADMSGRLGAFQSTTLETNINSLNSTLANLTSAKSDITDADFATETSNLERAQILQQSGMTVLSLADSAPKQILTLLQNA
jgi:flagellin-like hook-associated protein FlgL